jgi:hypothetical protein
LRERNVRRPQADLLIIIIFVVEIDIIVEIEIVVLVRMPAAALWKPILTFGDVLDRVHT